MPINILLTGANGLLGRAISQYCTHDQSISCHSLTRSELDITNRQQIATTLDALKPDWVINTAAYVNTEGAEENPELAFAVNDQGAKNLAIATHECHIPLVHFSSDYIFDGKKDTPYNENDIPAPLNVYGQSKWQGECAIATEQPEHLIFRVSWIFGSQGRNFVKTIAQLARTKPTLQVVADQIGAPTPADDIAAMVIDVIKKRSQGKGQWGTYNYCATPALSWYEFAVQIVEIMHRLDPNTSLATITPVTSEQYITKAKRPLTSRLYTDKIYHDYGVLIQPWLPALEAILRDS